MLSLAGSGGFSNDPFRSGKGERCVPDGERRNNGTYSLRNCRAAFDAAGAAHTASRSHR